MNRIDALFARLRAEGQRALMPFLTAGDPDLDATAAIVREVLRRGAHMIELGIPYSDPVADGPVITASYTRALDRGVKLRAIFEMVRSLRTTPAGSAVTSPLVTMVSYAIVHRHGTDRYVAEAADAGIDGLIVPDLPVEEAEGLLKLAGARDVSLIQLITPRTPRDRALRIAQTTTGFIYYVSVAGITGERRAMPTDLADNVAWLREQTSLPVCIGFGISDVEHVRQLAPVADGLIVGSAIVRRVAGLSDRPRAELITAIGDFIAELAAPLSVNTRR